MLKPSFKIGNNTDIPSPIALQSIALPVKGSKQNHVTIGHAAKRNIEPHCIGNVKNKDFS